MFRIGGVHGEFVNYAAIGKVQAGRAVSRLNESNNFFVGSTAKIRANMVSILVCGRGWWCAS
jgi:hypothetical protein